MCLFLGYDTESKAYILFDKNKRKILVSKDIVFDESKVGYQYLRSSKPDHSYFEFPKASMIEESTSETVDNLELSKPKIDNIKGKTNLEPIDIPSVATTPELPSRPIEPTRSPRIPLLVDR